MQTLRNLLIDESPMMILPSLAAAIGVNNAIWVQQLHYKLMNTNNVKDGRKWYFNTLKGWGEEFIFWSPKTLQRTIEWSRDNKLVDATSKYNRFKTDRTLWYSINYPNLDQAWEDGKPKVKLTNSTSGQDDQLQIGNVARCTCGQLVQFHLGESAKCTSGHHDHNGLANSTKPITKDINKDSHREHVTNTGVVVPSSLVSVDVPALLQDHFSETFVVELIQTYSLEYLHQKLLYLQFEQIERQVDNPAGWLRKAIENDYKEPKGYRTPEQIQEEIEAEQAHKERLEVETKHYLESLQREKEEEEARKARRLEKVRDAREEWDSLTQQQLSLWESITQPYNDGLEDSIYLIGIRGNSVLAVAIEQDCETLFSNNRYMLDCIMDTYNRETQVMHEVRICVLKDDEQEIQESGVDSE